jgi:ABC-type transport system involved in multi-copper enzyme maturation permease subunit
MGKMLAIATAVVRDAIRRKIVWIVFVFAVLLAFAAPSLPSYGAGVVDAVYREVSIALMYLSTLVVTLALCSSRIPNETERRTVYNVLGHDVFRWQYVVGTWAGTFAVVGVVAMLLCTVAIAVGAIVYGSFMWRLYEAGLAVWLEMGVIGALTVAVSAGVGIVTTVVAALGFTLGGHAVSTLFTGGNPELRAPWWLPSLDVFNVVAPVAHGNGYSVAFGLSMLVAFCGWVGVLMFAGSALYGRRDL